MGARVVLYAPDGSPAVTEPSPQSVREVVRSVSFKLNLGNYQSMDFFCSQKAQCAAEDAEEVSTDLYDWCYDQVMASVKDVQQKQARKQAAMERKTA
jgi:hypothetical protein